MKNNSLQAKTQVTDAKEHAQNCLVLPESAEEQPTKENNPPHQSRPASTSPTETAATGSETTVPFPTANDPTLSTSTAQTPPKSGPTPPSPIHSKPKSSPPTFQTEIKPAGKQIQNKKKSVHQEQG